MSIKPEDFAAAQKASVETFFSLTNKAFESIVKLTHLNIATAQEVLEQASSSAQESLKSKDPQALLATAQSSVQPMTEKALAYSKQVYAITSAAQSELSKFVEAQIAHNNEQLTCWLDKATQNAPQGSEALVSIVKSSIASANSAYDTLNKAAKQAIELAESNVEKAIKTPAPKAK